MKDLQHRTRSGAFWAYVQNGAGRGMTLLVFFVLARLLSPGDFGAFAVATVVLTLGEVFVEFGLAHAIVQRDTLAEAHLSSAFWVTLGLGGVLAALALLGAPALARSYGHPEIASVVRCLTPVFVMMALASVPAALLRRELNYRALAGRTALANGLSGLAAIGAAWAGLGVWAFVIQLNIFHLVGVIVLWRAEKWRPRFMLDWGAIRQMGGYTSGMILLRMFDFAESRLLDLVVGKYAGMAGLGNYSLAARANQAQTQLIAAPMWEVAGCALSRTQSDLQRFRSMMHEMARNLSLFAMPMLVGVAVLAEPLVRIVFGKQWDTAWQVLAVFSVLGAIRVPLYLCGISLQALGHSLLSAKMSVVRVVAIFAWAFVLPGTSPARFAAAVMLAQLTVSPLLLYVYRRYSGDSIWVFVSAVKLPLIASTVAGGAASCMLYAAPLRGGWGGAAAFVVFSIVYLLFCWKELLRHLSRKQKRVFDE